METILSVGLSNAATAGLLALVAALVGRWCRRPALVHGLWLLVLVKLVTPPVMTLPLTWLASLEEAALVPAEPELMAPIVVEEGSGEFDSVPVVSESMAIPEPVAASWHWGCWPPLVLLTWATGTIAWLVLAAVRSTRFRRCLRFAEPGPGWLCNRVAGHAARLGLRGVPSVWLLPGRLSPMLWPLGRETGLFIPSGLLTRLSVDQLDALLVHELAHCKRGDHWARAVELLATALYWWLPIVWWARRELREAEEQCCDAWVVWALPGARRAYALALVETVDFLSEPPPGLPALASGLGHVHDLKRRITMIMRGATPRLMGWAGLTMLLGLAVAVLPLLPVLAQDRPRPEPPPAGDRKPEDRKPETDKGRAEIKELEEKLADLRAKVRETEEQLERARRRASDTGERRTEERIVIRLQGQDGKVQTIELPAGTRVLSGPGGMGHGNAPVPTPVPPRPPAAPVAPVAPDRVRPPEPGLPPPPTPAPAAEGDLKRRIEDLSRQIEDLRRQMRSEEGGRGVNPRNILPRDPNAPRSR